ncbi:MULTISPECIES: ParA family protein [unclassified Micromonospora]|uniref:ParA family protein n=1 Tax=unclassified Micromonospora TaxID=2617518 RepID=UPI00098CF2D2|nr:MULTISPECIES: ParA family protein [unclassified Micromonospora]OON27056.1 chromosome partitioning protein [Micromonospora sp. Rc5]
MLVIAVVNLKGGSTKTTTTGHLGQAFHEAGMRVLGVDADGENESLQGWQLAGDLPWPVVTMAVPNLHKQLPDVVGDRYDVVVIDTPPMKAQRGTVFSAARIATHVLVPMAPTPIEYDRLPAVRELLQEAADVRPDGKPPIHAVLLTRVKPRAASTGVYRQLITDDGVTVLNAQIGSLERFAQAWGDPMAGALDTPYGAAAMELLDLADRQEVSA